MKKVLLLCLSLFFAVGCSVEREEVVQTNIWTRDLNGLGAPDDLLFYTATANPEVYTIDQLEAMYGKDMQYAAPNYAGMLNVLWYSFICHEVEDCTNAQKLAFVNNQVARVAAGEDLPYYSSFYVLLASCKGVEGVDVYGLADTMLESGMATLNTLYANNEKQLTNRMNDLIYSKRSFGRYMAVNGQSR